MSAEIMIIIMALSSGIEPVGIAPLSLHLFEVFLAVLSTVTPPIAGADPVRTAFEAARLSMPGFLAPFVFVHHPAVLYELQCLIGWIGEKLPESRAMIDSATVTWFDFFWGIAAVTLAIWLPGSAGIGFGKSRLHIYERAVRAVCREPCYCRVGPLPHWLSSPG